MVVREMHIRTVFSALALLVRHESLSHLIVIKSGCDGALLPRALAKVGHNGGPALIAL